MATDRGLLGVAGAPGRQDLPRRFGRGGGRNRRARLHGVNMGRQRIMHGPAGAGPGRGQQIGAGDHRRQSRLCADTQGRQPRLRPEVEAAGIVQRRGRRQKSGRTGAQQRLDYVSGKSRHRLVPPMAGGGRLQPCRPRGLGEPGQNAFRRDRRRDIDRVSRRHAAGQQPGRCQIGARRHQGRQRGRDGAGLMAVIFQAEPGEEQMQIGETDRQMMRRGRRQRQRGHRQRHGVAEGSGVEAEASIQEAVRVEGEARLDQQFAAPDLRARGAAPGRHQRMQILG